MKMLKHIRRAIAAPFILLGFISLIIAALVLGMKDAEEWVSDTILGSINNRR